MIIEMPLSKFIEIAGDIHVRLHYGVPSIKNECNYEGYGRKMIIPKSSVTFENMKPNKKNKLYWQMWMGFWTKNDICFYVVGPILVGHRDKYTFTLS